MESENTEEIANLYKKLIENELSRTEEEKAERDKWNKEYHPKKKYYHLELDESATNIIKLMNLLEKIHNEKT